MRAVWQFLGYLFLAGALAFMLWMAVPRVVSDLVYRDGFVPAETARATKVRCKTWGGFVATNCTVTYTMRGSSAEHEIEDFHFGWAADGPYRLMQHRDVPERVTTDVSLAAVWNRAAFALVFAAFGVAMMAMGVSAVVRRVRG